MSMQKESNSSRQKRIGTFHRSAPDRRRSKVFLPTRLQRAWFSERGELLPDWRALVSIPHMTRIVPKTDCRLGSVVYIANEKFHALRTPSLSERPVSPLQQFSHRARSYSATMSAAWIRH